MMKKLALFVLPGMLFTIPALATQIDPAICALGYDKRDFKLEVPKSIDAPLMFTVLDKPCDGPVLIRFTTETFTDGTRNIKVTLRTRCMVDSAYVDGCIPGQLLYPQGNVASLVVGTQGGRTSHSFEFIIEHQTRGKWKYELMLNADHKDGKGYVRNRSMVVEAHHELK
jgi:hypothetical protein